MAQLALLAFSLLASPSSESWCATGKITGYVRQEYGPLTADGTSIYSDEPIAAGGYAYPLGAYVDVDGVGTFRVADRGRLGPTDVDIAVWSRSEAYSLTSVRRVCVRGAEE